MLRYLRRIVSPKIMTALIVIIGVAGIGSYVLASSHALSPADGQTGSATKLLQSYSLGTAPYQYIAYSGSLTATSQATGIKQYFAAFVISDGGCEPSWGGVAQNNLTSQRSSDIASDFTALRAAGGEVTVSFGGASGTELAASCDSVGQLTQAYQSVIDRYGLKQLDFDIEGPNLLNGDTNARRAAAITALQTANPGLKVWTTLPVSATKGLTPEGTYWLAELVRQKAVLSGINIMAMNYNARSSDMGQRAIVTSQATFEQIQRLYPAVAATDIWKAMGITIMVGQNNTLPETFNLADAKLVHDFALRKQVGMISLWNAGRDIACPAEPAAAAPVTEPSISCSGIDQQPYQFMHTLQIPARS